MTAQKKRRRKPLSKQRINVTIRLPRRTLERLDAVCAAEELTRTEFIESAVEERLERGEG